MNDEELNDDIFGYRIYNPPPETDMPVIADLNCYGEIVTLIDADEDVIKNSAIQNIFKNLDGERTVKIEELPPDFRYDGWNKKALYNRDAIPRHIPGQNQNNMMPRQPVVNQMSFLANDDKVNTDVAMESLKQAQMKAQQVTAQDQQLVKQLQATRMQLEKEIHKQLVEQLTLRAQKRSASPEHQAQIEKLYGDLKLINPQLASATMKASAELEGMNMHEYVAPTLRVPQQIPQHIASKTYDPSMMTPQMIANAQQQQQQQQQQYQQQKYQQQQFQLQQQQQQQQQEQQQQKARQEVPASREEKHSEKREEKRTERREERERDSKSKSSSSKTKSSSRR